MSTITFQGKPIHTSGALPALHSKAPDFKLVTHKLTDVSLKDFAGKKKILNILPSLDTPTCATSARKFNEKASSVDNAVVLLISTDLPFAQSRFCTAEGLKDVIPLSCFRSSFATDYGVLLTDSILAGLTARAIVVIDEHDNVIHTELVAEIADEPDYHAALEAVKG